MSREPKNQVDQDVYSSGHFAKNENKVEFVAPSVASADAQQPRVDRGGNEGQGDMNILHTIVDAFQRVAGATHAVVLVLACSLKGLN